LIAKNRNINHLLYFVYRTLIGTIGKLSIGKLAIIQLTTPLLLHKPCKRFASVARICQRQLAFLVLHVTTVLHLRYPSDDDDDDGDDDHVDDNDDMLCIYFLLSVQLDDVFVYLSV